MKLTKYILFLCFVFLLGRNFSLAQQYNFKNFAPKNGLASSIVNNIFQDSKGYIWFGTQGGGVSRFNGKLFKNYTKAEGLIANDVTFVTEDHSGNIWIATSEGASRFDGVTFTNFTEKDGLSKGSVYCIYADEKNNIWFGMQEGGMNKYDGKTFTAFGTKDGLPSDNLFAITQDKKGDYWLALSNGIAKYDGTRITSYDKHPLINNRTFFCNFSDSKGNVWFGGISGYGVVKYDGTEFHKLELPEAVEDDFFGSIAEDKNGNIWFATDHGALKYDGKNFHLFDEHQGLSSNGVLSICNDYEGNIWIGTQGGGVNLFNNESFVNFTDKAGLTSKNISTVVQYDEDTYLIGTTGLGLNEYNARTNTFKTSCGIKEVDESTIFSVVTDNEGRIWIGAQEGVFVLKKNRDKYELLNFYNKNVAKTEVLAALKIIQDKNHDLWIASYSSGLFRVHGKEIVNYSTRTGFVSDKVLTVFTDSKNNIWIGTKDAGVVRYDGRTFTNFSVKEGLADKSIWAITEDNKGNMFFGTGESGLACYDGKMFRTISAKDGLCSNYILALTFDPVDNGLWLGTEKGINKIKLNPDLGIESIRYYGEQEGYKGIEINQNAILQDKSGQVWFGTINGLSRYNRQYDFPNVTPPKLHLSGIRLAYQTVDWKLYADSVDPSGNLPVNLELSHKNNNLTFDFQAFTTDNVKYTFILEGQDEAWSPLSTNAEAVFTNISPGKTYTFKVKAVNSNGVWSKEVIAFSFAINPPWWQTWWFYTIVGLVALIGISGFVNYRTAQLAKEKKVLEEKVTERTVELKQANDQLSVAFQDIKDSINYAKKIQDAILPLEEEIKKALPQSFVLFKPRDVVSGDFYWFNKKEDKIFIAAVDCTGHGVPGAFMSMIGSSLLNEIISKKGPHDAAGVLKKLHQGVRKSLKQDRDSYESKDGMDLALAVIDITANTLQYSGAKRPMFHYNNGSFEEVKADKQSIGGLEMEDNYSFTNHNVELKKGDTFYLFTDGYVDQFGGEKGKKFSTRRLKETLEELQELSMKDQGAKLNFIIDSWKSEVEQIDDILVIGFRF
jgi:ligand-binding sensor domain-containing protein/serine phosphatase RsbU (regulator of sigma subunit)